MGRQIGVNLGTGTVDHHQFDSQAVQQPDIIDDIGKIFMFDGFATQHDHESFTAMRVDIGN